MTPVHVGLFTHYILGCIVYSLNKFHLTISEQVNGLPSSGAPVGWWTSQSVHVCEPVS